MRPLTPRQAQVLTMLRDGYTVNGIAQALWLSPETIRYHTKIAYRNLGVHSRLEALAALPNAPHLEPGRCPTCGRSTLTEAPS